MSGHSVRACLKENKMKSVTVHAALAAVLMTSAAGFAQDASAEAASDSEQRSVKVTINQSSVQKDGEDADTKVSGKIVVVGPDGERREYNLGKDRVKGLTIRRHGFTDDGELIVDNDLVLDDVLGLTVDAEPRFLIGVMCEAPSEALRSHLKLEKGGLIVTQVSENLPAAKAGIEKHDVLLSVGDRALNSLKDLIDVVRNSEGKELDIALIRGGAKQSVKVTAEKRSPSQVSKEFDTRSLIGFTDDEDGEGRRITRILRAHPGVGRNLIFGPGVRMEAGQDVDIHKMITEAHNLARKHMKDAEDAAAAADSRQNRVDELQKEIEELKKRLDSLEDE